MTTFVTGDPVRIPALPTIGHSRVPEYVRGRVGHVERVLTPFAIPEDDAWRRLDGRRKTLYRVRFPQRELWPDYQGGAGDVLEIEIFEHWLEEVEA